jgi:hypothetical protein
MSTFDADNRDTMGYFLPENSQRRLQKLRDYAEFLSHIAQPRAPDAEQQGLPKINAEQVAICLEFLVEQMDVVLSGLSFPAYRPESDAAPTADRKAEGAEAMPDDAAGNYLFGMTLEQVDTLNPLIDMIAAHGDVVIASHGAELADHTLSLLGQAIFSDARTVREIIRQVESQRLDLPHSSHSGVNEEQAVYRIERKNVRVH